MIPDVYILITCIMVHGNVEQQNIGYEKHPGVCLLYLLYFIHKAYTYWTFHHLNHLISGGLIGGRFLIMDEVEVAWKTAEQRMNQS